MSDGGIALGHGHLPGPLKGGVRFGNKGTDADCDLASTMTTGTGRQRFLRKIADGINVFWGLSGQSDHEV